MSDSAVTSEESKAEQQESEKKQLTLNEVYYLRKAEIIEQLKKRGVEVDETDTRDNLRERLAELVRVECSKKEAEVREPEVKEPENEEPEVKEDLNSSSNSIYSDAEEEETMASDSKLFFKESDDWEAFSERLEFHFLAKKITQEDMKKAELLTHVDEATYKLVKTLCAPSKPSEKTFDEIVQLLTKHLKPASSELMERCKFNRAKQEPNESVAEFATRLKQLAINCNFTTTWEKALQVQFAMGIRDEATRFELFKSKTITFESALEEALAREEAAKNSVGAAQALTNKTYKQETFAIHTGRQDRGRKFSKRQQATEQQTAEVKCYCCGKLGHETNSCKYRDRRCDFCHKKGHLEQACIKKKNLSNKFLEEESSDSESDVSDKGSESSSSRSTNFIDFHNIRTAVNISECNAICAEPIFFDVKINDKIVSMEFDSGTYYSVMSEGFVNKTFKNIKISNSKTNLISYENKAMEPRGQLKNLTVVFNNKTEKLSCLILKGDKVPLIGRQWLSIFGLWPLERLLNSDIIARSKHGVYNMRIEGVRETLLNEFETLFSDTPGIYNKREIKIHIKPNVKPIALGARHMPYALRPKVEQEIDRLVKLGNLEKVESSEWATPIVPIQKGNGRVRICGDFKVTVNQHIQITRRPLAKIDDIFAVMQNGSTFSQLDLPHAYMQCSVEKESRKYLTVTTHVGLFQYTRMTEGISLAPSEFTQIMTECLQGIPNVINYMDNIYVTGKTNGEHFENLRTVCHRLTERGLRLNKDKCDFMKDRIELLGFVIDRDGLHKAKSKVVAMYEAPRPENTKQLESFLGLINFYERFLENKSAKLKPLFDCARKDKFEWTKECDDAFWWVKNEMISPKVLAHYDPNEELILACDASHYGLAAILSHKYKDSTEKPIAFASKRIPDKELNRAINDKEAAAIVFGFKKFYSFVFGRKVTLRTDHKPLEFIFSPKKGIPQTAASRLQRWAIFLSGFDYEIEWIKSSENANCDALSRLPIEDTTEIFENNHSRLHFIADETKMLDYEMVVKETKRDATLSRIIKFCIFGWPKDSKDLSESEKKYFSKQNELSVEENCLFWGYRLVIPESLRDKILNDLHLSHLGIVKMKAMARSYVWWPGIDANIEDIANFCNTCVENRKKPPHAPLTPWPWPERAWQRVHCDFLGPFHGDMYLVVLDSFSKWPEVINFKQDTRACKLIQVFEMLFARHGLCEHLVSDNGRQLASSEFREYLQRNGVKHSFSPPYHPATNGAAENFVGTFKKGVSKIIKGGKKVDTAVHQFLFDYRSAPHSTTGKSPAQLLYGRELRTRFDLLRPNLRSKVEEKQGAQIAGRPHSRKIKVQEGDSVMIDNHGKSGEKRIKGEIVKQLSPSTYQVQTESGNVTKRHTKQIVKPLRRSERIARKQRI